MRTRLAACLLACLGLLGSATRVGVITAEPALAGKGQIVSKRGDTVGSFRLIPFPSSLEPEFPYAVEATLEDGTSWTVRAKHPWPPLEFHPPDSPVWRPTLELDDDRGVTLFLYSPLGFAMNAAYIDRSERTSAARGPAIRVPIYLFDDSVDRSSRHVRGLFRVDGMGSPFNFVRLQSTGDRVTGEILDVNRRVAALMRVAAVTGVLRGPILIGTIVKDVSGGPDGWFRWDFQTNERFAGQWSSSDERYDRGDVDGQRMDIR